MYVLPVCPSKNRQFYILIYPFLFPSSIKDAEACHVFSYITRNLNFLKQNTYPTYVYTVEYTK